MKAPQLIKDLGRLYANDNSAMKRRYGLYECECGNEFRAIRYAIESGRTKSCGCYHKKKLTKHGQSNNRIYHIWENIIQRCTNKTGRDYHAYGGRGIQLCDEWRNSFKVFHEWAISNGYKDSLTIDRIDNNGNYEPSNCRWATYKIQARNKQILSSANTSGYRGVYFHKQCKKFVASIRYGEKRKHLGLFKEAKEAAKAYDKYVIDNNLEHTKNFE